MFRLANLNTSKRISTPVVGTNKIDYEFTLFGYILHEHIARIE